MKRYLVEFASTSAEVEAKNEGEAIVLAKELLYEGELMCEVASVEEVSSRD